MGNGIGWWGERELLLKKGDSPGLSPMIPEWNAAE
jgi:hypothetical protein